MSLNYRMVYGRGETFFDGINEIPTACVCYFDSNLKPNTYRYWNPPNSVSNSLEINLQEEFEKQEVLEIPSLKIFGKSKGVAWMRLQELLEKRGNPPYSIGGDLMLYKEPIKSLGNLVFVGGNLDLRGTGIKSLGKLKSVEGYLDLELAPIESLGNLTSVYGYLDLTQTPIKSLGDLTYVDSYLDLKGTPIESLGNLRTIGGGLLLSRTPLSEMYSKEEIREMVNVGGDIVF